MIKYLVRIDRLAHILIKYDYIKWYFPKPSFPMNWLIFLFTVLPVTLWADAIRDHHKASNRKVILRREFVMFGRKPYHPNPAHTANQKMVA